MKKNLLLFIYLLLTSAVYAQPKLSPNTRLYLQEIDAAAERNELPEEFIYKELTDGAICISTLIKVKDAGLAATELESIDARVGTKAGNIWTVQVPVMKMKELSRMKSLAYVQADEPVIFPTMDSMRHKTNVDSAHAGYDLSLPYSGKNVVMGIIDFGFDYNHPAMWDTSGKEYRIKKVWELNAKGTPPKGYDYGHEITDAKTLRERQTDNPVQTHGTGVAGIASGSGFGDDYTEQHYRGVAYASDMVFVGVRRDSLEKQWMHGGFSDFLDGVNYIFEYAKSVRRPAVVNISWGSQSGPHDGTTLFNEACDNLSGEGRIIVMSAGNDGTERLHLNKTFTLQDTVIKTFLAFNPDHYKRTWVDIWGDTAKTFCAMISLTQNVTPEYTTGYFCLDNKIQDANLITSTGDTCYVRFLNTISEFNDKPRMTISIFNKTSLAVAVAVKGTDGSIDVWNESYYYGYPYQYSSEFISRNVNGYTNGNTASTVSDMGAAKSVLLVGAYASKINFTDINNIARSYSTYTSNNSLVPFSSRGPMADGRIKPDITAPGLTIATAISSLDTAYTPAGTLSSQTVREVISPIDGKKYYYAEFSGTSASAPAASGIVALMLQANPYLTPQQAKDIIFETAIQDARTGNLPAEGNNNWGHGKINAYRAVKAAEEKYDALFNDAIFDCQVYPNPFTDKFTIDFRSRVAETMNIQLYGSDGKLAASHIWKTSPGINQEQFNTANLHSGMYIIKLVTPRHTKVLKMMKL